MEPFLSGLSSKATAKVLAELAVQGRRQALPALHIESVGGMDAARRVVQGEHFDIVCLAADALDRLIAAGHLRAPRLDLMRSPMVAAVRAGAERPDIETEAALRRAVLTARRIGCSTGPSGDHVLRLLRRWQVEAQAGDAMHSVQTVQAPPGVPVGQLLASGEVVLGFQQRSELLHHVGVDVLGELPDPIGLVTVFAAAISAAAASAEGAASWLAYVASPAAAAVLRRHGMEPA